MGGWNNAVRTNDVWSFDGSIWSQVTASAPWSARSSLAGVVYDNKIYIMGGYNGTNFNDVWESGDGSNWLEGNYSNIWSSRRLLTAVVYSNKIYIMGGYDGSSFNDVWSWELCEESTPMRPPSKLAETTKAAVVGGWVTLHAIMLAAMALVRVNV